MTKQEIDKMLMSLSPADQMVLLRFEDALGTVSACAYAFSAISSSNKMETFRLLLEEGMKHWTQPCGMEGCTCHDHKKIILECILLQMYEDDANG